MRKDEKALQLLNHQFQSFIDQQNNWEFFRGLAEYTKTLSEMTATKPLIEALERQRKASRKIYEQLNTQAFKEFQQSAKKMSTIVEEVKNLEPVHLTRSLKEVQGYLDGSILSSNVLQGLDHSLFDVARRIKELGIPEKVKVFEDLQKKTKNIYGDYTFSKTYDVLNQEEGKLKRKEQVEPWGAWERLPMVERIVFEPDELKEEFQNEAKKNPDFKWTLLNFYGIAGEMEKIRSGEASDDDVVFFTVKDFKNFAQRVHNHITSQLIKDQGVSLGCVFDPEQSVLIVNGNELKIKKFGDQYHTLRIIFENKSEVPDEWFFSRISEKYDSSGNLPDKKFYNAIYQISLKLKRIGIDDFFVTTRQSVKINKKYLS